MKKEIFKMYDIRGVYDTEIEEGVVYKIGRAFTLFLNKKNPQIAVARDGRESSPSLFEAFKKGVFDAGGDVIDIGLAPTPLLNFTVAKYDYDGGAVISASHSPAEVNGIKLIKGKAVQIYGEDIQKVKKIAEETKEDYEKGKIDVEELNPLSEYLDHITSLLKIVRELRVVIDCGNGMGGVTARPAFSRFPGEVSFMYEEIDGTFPHHPPDPHNLKNIIPLQKKVLEEKADLGIFFDGDADRSVLVDEKGEIVFPDILLALFAEKELSAYPGEKIYYDLRFSKAVEEVIKENKGKPVMMRVGNPFYKEKIIMEEGILGGELSGHIMFKENFGIDDGLFAALKAMSIISEKREPLSRIVAPYKRYFQSEEINLEVKNKDEVIDKVRDFFSDGEEIVIDGLYVQYPKWWFNLRKSNTENVVRLRIEAKTRELLEEKREKLISLLT